MGVTNLQAFRQAGDKNENDQMARHFEDAAKRARKGEFKSVCWVAVGRDEFGAHFGWLKFGSIMPLIGATYTMLHEMASSPALPLEDLEEDDDGRLPVGTGIGDEGTGQLDLFERVEKGSESSWRQL